MNIYVFLKTVKDTMFLLKSQSLRALEIHDEIIIDINGRPDIIPFYNTFKLVIFSFT